MPEVDAAAQGLLEQLAELCGQPVRVTVLEPATSERLVRMAGVLSAVSGAGLEVECLQPVPMVPAGAPVTVEVLVNGNLVWYHSVTLTPSARSRSAGLLLQQPSAIQTLQRRRFPRLDVDVPVHLVAKSTGAAIEATMRDLSAGGASVRVSEPLSAGAQFLLMFTLGSGLFFQDLEADVVRCTDAPNGTYAAGLRFCLTPEQEAALSAWVRRQMEGAEGGYAAR